jgi:gas vesicle protein
MHYDNQAENGSGFAMGVLCGVAVGAILGLLFAPTNGREFRGKIGEGARWIGDQSKGVYQSAKRSVNDAVSTGRSAFDKSRAETVGPNV